MDLVVQSYVSNGTFAGSVLVARGSDVIVSKGSGLANVEWNVPSSPSARFRVASIFFAAWHVRRENVCFDELRPGDAISFELGWSADCRPQATEVRVLRASAITKM